MTFWEKLTTAVLVMNEVSGGTLLPVVAGLLIFAVTCGLIAIGQTRGGDRG